MDVALCILRAVHVAAIAIVAGCSFGAMMTGRARPGSSELHRIWRYAVLAAAVALAAHVGLVAVNLERLAEGGTPLRSISLVQAWAQTWIGRTHLFEGAGLVLVILMLLMRARPACPGVGAALCLAGGALAGHAAAGSDSVALSFAAIAHVGLAGLWFGFLPVLLLLRRDAAAPGPSAIISVLPRFSTWALPGMLGVLATGVTLARWTVASWPALFGTRYGEIICVKLGLVLAVLFAAAMLRWRRLPRALRDGEPRPLLRLIAFELVVACGVVLAASTVAQTVPAAHDEILWPFSFRLAPTIAWQTVPLARERIMVGASMVVLGLAGAALLRRRTGAILAGTIAIGAAASGFAISLSGMAVAAYPTTYVHSSSPFDAEGTAEGAQLFRDNCAVCHGASGRGDGSAAAMLNPRPADLTAPHLGYHTHGDLFWWLTNGYAGSAMPGFGGALTDAQRWHLVDYLMALSLGYQARVLSGKTVARDPWLPAIDFRYPAGNGGFALLSDKRGTTSVLLVLIAGNAGLARLKLLAEASDHFAAASGRLVAVVAPGVDGALPAQRGFDLAVDSDESIARAWSLYRRTPTNPDFNDAEPMPPRLEFLIDRFGFVRARWRSDESPDGPNVALIEEAMRNLAAEPEIVEADAHQR